MSPSFILISLFFCYSSYADFTGHRDVAVYPSIYTLGSDGTLHLQSTNIINGRDQRIKLSKSRTKRPVKAVLDEAMGSRLGVKPDIYGGESLSLLGDTAVPNVPDSNDHQESPAQQRNRRQAVRQNHIVETLLFLDYPLFLYWLERNGNDSTRAKNEMIDFYSNIINAVNGRLATIGFPLQNTQDNGYGGYKSNQLPFFTVQMSVAGYIIADSPTAVPWTQTLNDTNTIDAEASLNQFMAYINANRASLPPHDHAMTVTGFDLTRGGRAGLVGLANQNRTCSLQSVSIVERLLTQETATLIAHELAHSMGAAHDGDGNSCLNNATNVMSTSISVPTRDTASNPWIFSTCSAQAVFQYLSSRPDQCTLRQDTAGVDLKPFLREEFGQKYPHDVQCEIYRGTGSKFCRADYFNNRTFADLCYTLYCEDPIDKLCYPTLAHDGTSCGNKMWCRSGVCTFSQKAPATPENCPAGDDPDVACNTTLCTDTAVRDMLCCGTCKTTRPHPNKGPTGSFNPSFPRPPVQDPFGQSAFNDFFSKDFFGSSPFQNSFPKPIPFKPFQKRRPSYRPKNTGFHTTSSFPSFNIQQEFNSIFGGYDDPFSYGFGKK